MTPSNANTSGLEVVRSEIAQMVCGYWLKRGKHTASDRAWTEALETADRIIGVTAASAQAEREQYGRWLVAMANDRDAEKARADRLAKALDDCRLMSRQPEVQAIARAALQQEG